MEQNNKTFIKWALIYGIAFAFLIALFDYFNKQSIYILKNVIGGLIFGLGMSYFKLRSEKKRKIAAEKTPTPSDDTDNESDINESTSKPGDEFLVAAVLNGMREGRRDAIKPDFSNLEAHMKRSFTVSRTTPEEVMSAVTNFVGDPKTLADNYSFLPYDIHPNDGEGEWTEESVKKYVNDMKRKGFGYYGHINDNDWPLIILSKKRSSLNTLVINKPLDANQFWNDYYANYQPTF